MCHPCRPIAAENRLIFKRSDTPLLGVLLKLASNCLNVLASDDGSVATVPSLSAAVAIMTTKRRHNHNPSAKRRAPSYRPPQHHDDDDDGWLCKRILENRILSFHLNSVLAFVFIQMCRTHRTGRRKNQHPIQFHRQLFCRQPNYPVLCCACCIRVVHCTMYVDVLPPCTPYMYNMCHVDYT